MSLSRARSLVGRLWASALMLLLAVLAGCKERRSSDYTPVFGDAPAVAAAAPTYRFAIFPMHSSLRLLDVYQPLAEAINRRGAGFTVQIESSRDFASLESKIRHRQVQLALLNPYEAIEAERSGYRIFAKMGGDDRMRGIIVVRKDAGIRSVGDLRGAAISFPSPTALAATMMTKMFLRQHGLNVEEESSPQYVGSQDSAVMNVYQGLTKAGCTWPPTWDFIEREQPEVVAALEVKWQTDSLPSLAVLARDDVPAEHQRVIGDVLFGLHDSAEGQKILRRMGIPRYEPASSAVYDPVRRFVEDYEHVFGNVPKLAGD